MTKVDVDFVVNYPCYFVGLGQPPRELAATPLELGLCVWFFTDHDQAVETSRAMLTEFFSVIACPDRNTLIACLDQWRKMLEENNVRHLTIDPTPGKRPAMVEITEFLRCI